MALDSNAAVDGEDYDADESPSDSEIAEYVIRRGWLPDYSARPMATWLWDNWHDWAEGPVVVEAIIRAAVTDWCGGRAPVD